VRLSERENADRECGCDQRIIFFHEILRVRPRPIGALCANQAVYNARTSFEMQCPECLRTGTRIVKREAARPALVGRPDESRNAHIAVMGGQPLLGASDARIVRRPSDCQQSQDAVRGCGPVASKALAVVAGLVGIEFCGRKEKAAVGVVGVTGIEILTPFDEHARVFEEAIGSCDTGSPQRFERAGSNTGSEAGTPPSRNA
jgi:hypothetical protein